MIKFSHIKYLFVVAFLTSAVLGEDEWYTADDGTNYLIDASYNYNWYQALIECSSRNLSLVTISTEEKNNALVNVLKQSGKDHYWIGGVAAPVNGQRQFHWVATGEQFDYTYWWVGEPNGNGNENCVHIDGYDYHWNDNNCAGNKFALLCEETPLEVEIIKDITEFRSYSFSLNQALISQIQNVKLVIDSLLSSLIITAQQTQDALDKVLPKL